MFLGAAVFLEKIAKNPFVEGHDRFEGRGASGDRNQYNLYCRHRRFKYFSFNNFLEEKKKNIFQNNSQNYFWGHDYF